MSFYYLEKKVAKECHAAKYNFGLNYHDKKNHEKSTYLDH